MNSKKYSGSKPRNLNKILLFGFLLFAALFVSSVPPLFAAAEHKNKVRFSVSRAGWPVLDPHTVQGDLELHFNPNVFEGLYKIEPDTGRLIPAIAESHRWISPTVVEFVLRKGVLFHNGETCDAEAVKFSFERMAAVKDGFNWVKAIIPEFQKVEVIDPRTVRIHFSAHNSTFLISTRFFVILPPKLLREKGTDAFVKLPVGTGPFKVHSIDYTPEGKARRVVLLKNRDYWAKGMPRLERVVFLFGVNQQRSLDLLKNGKIDAMADLPIRNIIDVKKIGADARGKGQGLISWLLFNLSEHKKGSPVWHPKVRRAIMHAIDYDRILKIVYSGRASKNNQWAFPGLPGYVAGLPNFVYDPQLSRKLLQEAGYPDGFALHAYSDDVSLDEAKIVRSSLARIGISVTLDLLDEATNNGIITSRRDALSPYHKKLKEYDMMIGDFGWGLPHNYVTHLHTFSPESFCSMVDESYPGSDKTMPMFNAAKSAFGEEAANQKWEEITAWERERLSVAGLVLKNSYYAVPRNLDWKVFGSFDFSKAFYR